MIICKVCKCENEEHFDYCKNCGTQLEKPIKEQRWTENTQRPNYAPHNPYNRPVTPNNMPNQSNIVTENIQPTELVSVYMNLPDVDNPSVRTLQKVYVTKRQYAAMKAAGMFGENKGE